jgi:murein DD-endopeptidase MepM/ murein hydrolase activator NlpD
MDMYEVASGDTLTKIAVRENLNVSNLRRLNRLFGNEVYPGQIIRLRASSQNDIQKVTTSMQRPQAMPKREPTAMRTKTRANSEDYFDEVSETMGLLKDVSVHGESFDNDENSTDDGFIDNDYLHCLGNSKANETNHGFNKINDQSKERSGKLKQEDEVLTGAVADNFASRTSSPSASPQVFATDLFAANTAFAEEHIFVSVVSSPSVCDISPGIGGGVFVGAGTGSSATVEVAVKVETQRQQPNPSSKNGKDREDVPFVLAAPKIRGTSQILSLEQMTQMRDRLPPILQIEAWTLVYSLLSHGADMSSFYRNTRRRRHLYIVIRTFEADVFGGFVATDIKQSPDYYGNGECFLYRFDSEGEMNTYRWTGDNDFFILSNGKSLAMGGGGDGFGFVIDADFEAGETSSCKTFDNPKLAPKSASGHFKIQDIECWGFESEYA